MNYVFFWCMLLLCIVTHSISHRKHRRKAYHSLYKKSKNLNVRQQVVAPPTSTNGNFDLMQENEKLIDNSLYRRDDVDVFNQFNNDAPILWNGDMKQEKQGTAGTANAVSRGQVSKHGTKKDGGMGEIDEGDFPSTALQNPNIFGGFPENDIWGNFELPASETLDKLKSSLKVNHHKPNYGEDVSDSISELYGYEHHALPEYDILETPQFHETPRGQKVLQDIASSNGRGCPGMGSCPPIAAKIACQNIQTTCNDKEESSQAIDYESPCAAKILSLFGCKVNEKVDAPVEPLQQTSLSESPKEEAKTETKLEDKPELKLEAKIDSKLEAKPDVKIEAKPETKIDVKVESKPESKLNPKEDSKPEAKLEPKEDSKTEAKLEGKEDSKTKAKLKPMEDSKPEAKLEPMEDSKPEAKLDHKIEAKVELKPESDKEGNQHHEQQALSSETLFKSPNLEISLDNEKKHKTENSVAKLLSALRNSPSFQKTPVKSFSDDSANNEQSQEVLDGVGLKNDDESLTLGLMQDIGNDLQKTLTEKFDSNNDKNTTLPLNKKEGGETDSTITASITEKLPTVNYVTNDNKELKSYFQFVSSEPSKQQQKETQPIEVLGDNHSQFSDWSSWSTCSGCDVGMKTRRRNCLKAVCSGSTEETSPCSKKCLTDVTKPIVLNNTSPDNQLIEALQPAQFAFPSNQIAQSAILSNQTAQSTSSQGNFGQPQSTKNQPMASTNGVVTQHQFMINQSALSFSTTGAATQLSPLPNQSQLSPLTNQSQLSPLTNQSAESDDVRKEFEQLVLNKTFESVVNTFTQQLNESIKPDTQSIKTNDNVLIPPSQQSALQYNVKPATDMQLFEILSNKASVIEDTDLKPDVKMPNLIEQNIDSTRIILFNKGEDKNKINEYKSSSWGDWGECSRGCGIGIKSRTKKCDVKSCSGEVVQTKACHVKTCEDPELESSIKGGCLKLHNELRDRHGAAGLEWSDALYKKAHEITERIAVNSIPQKNLSQYERPGLNLNFVELTPSNNQSLDGPCLKAVSEWYGEKLNYDYETPKLTSEDRDFTQLVWKSTKRVGLARSLSPDGRNAYIAAVYEPIGNVDSFYDKKNELPVTPEERTGVFLNLRVATKQKKWKIVKNG